MRVSARSGLRAARGSGAGNGWPRRSAETRDARRTAGHPARVPRERAARPEARGHRPEPARGIRRLSVGAAACRDQPRGRDPRGRRADGRCPWRPARAHRLPRGRPTTSSTSGSRFEPACGGSWRERRSRISSTGTCRRRSAGSPTRRTRGSRSVASVARRRSRPRLPAGGTPPGARRRSRLTASRPGLGELGSAARGCRTRPGPRRCR